MKIYKPFGHIPLLLAITLTAGCGYEEADKVTAQVVARVNADEITLSQVNANLPPESHDTAKHEILSKLIDQQLAMQAAILKNLDRTPTVMKAIEAARAEILANAYLQEVAAKQTKPSPESVKKYYSEHPELFAERRIYNIEELLVQSAVGLRAKLEAEVAKARSLQDIAAWLKSQNIKFAANRGVRPAETLPLGLLPELLAIRDGEIRLFEAQGGLLIFRLAASKAAPVDESTAKPRIEQYLINRQATEIVAAELKRLRNHADITLIGEFGKSASLVANVNTETEAKAAAKSQDTIEKGPSNLK